MAIAGPSRHSATYNGLCLFADWRDTVQNLPLAGLIGQSKTLRLWSVLLQLGPMSERKWASATDTLHADRRNAPRELGAPRL